MADDVYLMMVDGKVQAVDLGPMMRRHRAAIVKARAGQLGGLMDALAIESLDVMEVCEASGLPEPLREAAAYLTLSMRVAELGELDDDG